MCHFFGPSSSSSSSENLAPTNERPRRILLQDDPDAQQPLLPETSSPAIEGMEVDKEPGHSQTEAMFSTPPVEDGQQFMQQPSSSEDDLSDASHTLDADTATISARGSQISRPATILLSVVRTPAVNPTSIADIIHEDVRDTTAVNPKSIMEIMFFISLRYFVYCAIVIY